MNVIYISCKHNIKKVNKAVQTHMCLFQGFTLQFYGKMMTRPLFGDKTKNKTFHSTAFCTISVSFQIARYQRCNFKNHCFVTELPSIASADARQNSEFTVISCRCHAVRANSATIEPSPVPGWFLSILPLLNPRQAQDYKVRSGFLQHVFYIIFGCGHSKETYDI